MLSNPSSTLGGSNRVDGRAVVVFVEPLEARRLLSTVVLQENPDQLYTGGTSFTADTSLPHTEVTLSWTGGGEIDIPDGGVQEPPSQGYRVTADGTDVDWMIVENWTPWYNGGWMAGDVDSGSPASTGYGGYSITLPHTGDSFTAQFQTTNLNDPGEGYYVDWITVAIDATPAVSIEVVQHGDENLNPGADTVPMIFKLTRTGPTDAPLQVQLMPGDHTTTFFGPQAGNNPSDHPVPPTLLTIPAGESEFAREIPVYDDGVDDEGTEYVDVEIVPRPDDYTIGTGTARLLIADDGYDDTGDPPTFPSGGDWDDDDDGDDDPDAWVDLRLGWYGWWHGHGGWHDGQPGEQHYGSTDDGDGLTTGHYVRLNGDFDEYDAQGGDGTDPVYDYENDGHPGIIPGDGEVVPLWLGMWDDGDGSGYGNPYGPGGAYAAYTVPDGFTAYGGYYGGTNPYVPPANPPYVPPTNPNNPDRGGQWTLTWDQDKLNVWSYQRDSDGHVVQQDGRPVMEKQSSGWSGHTDDLNQVSAGWWWGWGVGAFVEGTSESTDLNDFYIQADFEPDTGNAVSDEVRGTVMNAELDAATIDNNEVSGLLGDIEKSRVGAFVPKNDDDDDYDADNTPDQQQEDQAIDEEDDLLPITLNAVVPVALGGNYVLVGPDDAKFRVYRNQDRTEEVTEPIDATQVTKLYIEGRNPGSFNLNMKWVSDDGDDQMSVDKIKLTVFDLVGPINVPVNGTYRYTASPGGLPDGAAWVAAEGGIITVNPDNDNEAIVEWENGGTVGHASFRVNDSYKWWNNVNIVGVNVTKFPDGSFTYAKQSQRPDRYDVFDSPHGNDTASFTGISSGWLQQWNDQGYVTSPNGVVWRAHITMTGPINGRGIRFIDVGFVQSLTVTELKASYNNIPNDGVPNGGGDNGDLTLISSLEGNTYFDQKDGQAGKWYDSGTGALHVGSDSAVADDPHQDGSSGTIISSDSPAIAVPLHYRKQYSEYFLKSVDLVWNFNLFVAARTRDDVVGADSVYAEQSHAAWKWDGTGTFDWNTMIGDGNNGSPLWSGANTVGVVMVKDWDNDNMPSPDLDGPAFNDNVRNSGSHWYNAG